MEEGHEDGEGVLAVHEERVSAWGCLSVGMLGV